MKPTGAVVPLLVFEAADCLMALPADEVRRLETGDGGRSPFVDLGVYFSGRASDGPWLQWKRGERSAWLRVRRVLDVITCATRAMRPMPGLLRVGHHTGAFLATGVRGEDVFLLLDPSRLRAGHSGGSGTS